MSLREKLIQEQLNSEPTHSSAENFISEPSPEELLKESEKIKRNPHASYEGMSEELRRYFTDYQEAMTEDQYQEFKKFVIKRDRRRESADQVATHTETQNPDALESIKVGKKERFHEGNQVMVNGKLYEVVGYDGLTGDIIMDDSSGKRWSESQEIVYAQNPVVGEKYYDTDHGPVSKTELEASEAARKSHKAEVKEQRTQESAAASERIQELKKKIAGLSTEKEEKLRQTSGVVNKMNLERDYEKQEAELKKDIRKNQGVKARSFLNKLLDRFR